MGFFRSGRLRWLYVLALAQLVGGPLVLLQVTVFCKLALREAPRAGLPEAMSRAWSSKDFQKVLAVADVPKALGKTPDPVPAGPEEKLEKAKTPVVPWHAPDGLLAEIPQLCRIADLTRVWTPAWPQAPPGPPPRVG